MQRNFSKTPVGNSNPDPQNGEVVNAAKVVSDLVSLSLKVFDGAQ